MIHAAFALRPGARLLVPDFFEATSHLLSLRPDDLLTILKMALSIVCKSFGFPTLYYSSYEAPDFYLGGFSSH